MIDRNPDPAPLSDDALDGMIRSLPARRPRTDLARQAMQSRQSVSARLPAPLVWLSAAAAVVLIMTFALQFRTTPARDGGVDTASVRTRVPVHAWQTDFTHLERRIERIQQGTSRWQRVPKTHRNGDPLVARMKTARTRAQQLKDDLPVWNAGWTRTPTRRKEA